ncbi:F-box domain-containing protein [Mycena venus]|uniref:F-box domain-containing protein n=1 Tax=Mycena venus TaxID=2733690 RepID=A0A8H6XIQ5_9AGAR|nr:F-box domain-containing protein [Mycena venus]
MPSPKLEDLADDVLLYLLKLCEISSVLSLSQTCRYFHLLSQERQLWIALVQSLTHKLFRDPLPDENLQTLSTHGLLTLAKRAARGPETWVDSSPALAPTFVREVRVPCPMVHHANFFAGRAALLSGGQYVALAYRTTFMLLKVTNAGEVVGAHDTRGGAHIHSFSAEVAADQDSVVVVLYTELLAAPRRRGFEVIRFSMRTEGHVETPLALYVRKDLFNEGFWRDPELSGTHASIVIFNKPRWMVLVVDWAVSSYILVDVPQRPHTSMIPGHLVLACSSGNCIEISILHLDSLREHWQPIGNLDWSAAILNGSLLSTLPTIFFETISLNPGTIAEPLLFPSLCLREPAREQEIQHTRACSVQHAPGRIPLPWSLAEP